VADDRLDARDWRDLLGWIAAGIVGLVLAFKFFFVAFPEASLDLKISRDDALTRARQFVADQGHTLDDYKSSVVFQVDGNAKTYLEREMGLEQANRLMASDVNVWKWKARFFRPLQTEEFSVEVDPAGRIVGMTHRVEERAPGERLEKDAARAIAEEFLRARLKMDLDAFDYLEAEANSTDRPRRLDWSFTWERRGFKAKDAPYRLRVTLIGNSVGGYDEFLKVPEQWERDFQRLRSSNELFQWLGQLPGFFLQGAVFVVLLDLGRRGLIRWRGALKLGAVLAVLFFVMQANSLPLTRSLYDTKDSYSGFFLLELAQALLGSALLGMVLALTVAAAEPLYRKDYPEKLKLWSSCSLPALRSKEAFNATVIGLAMAAAHIGFVVLFYVVGKQHGFWLPQDIKYTDAVSTALPWIYPLAISLYAATSEEFLFRLFAIPFLMRVTKSKLIAIVLPAFIWGFLHSAYPVQPGYARGLEVGIIGVVAGWVMIRWGILATLVWHYTVDAALIGLFLLRSENLYFRLSGAVVAFAVLLPLGFAAFSYLRRRGFTTDESLFNRSEAIEAVQPEPVPLAAAPPVRRVYEGLSARALGLAVALGLAGGLLAYLVKPQTVGESVKFSMTAKQAAEQANDVLRERKVDPDSYRRVTTFVSTFRGIAAEYIRRQEGISGVSRIYGEKVPFAFWAVRYFRDSEKEEYRVILLPDGTLHSVHHELEEKAPGASLPKEEAQARAQAYLRDEKKLDLSKWKLAESSSEKRPARTDHTFIWEELEGVADAHVRVEVNVLGEEVSGYRIYVKLPEDWERAQTEMTLGRVAQIAFQLLFVTGFIVAVLVLFFKNLKQQTVPWRRMALWASWGALATTVTLLDAFPILLSQYLTEIPLTRFLVVLGIGQLLILALIYSGLFMLLGFGWFFLARAFGEGNLPAWRGMPASYYRDAFVLALGGIGFWAGFGRLRILLERSWPTERYALSASVMEGLDRLLPAATFIAGAVTAGLVVAGAIGLAAGFMRVYLPRRILQIGLLLLAAVVTLGRSASPADFAKSYLWAVLTLLVVWLGVMHLFRFNLLAYFVLAAGLALSSTGVQLLRQPAEFYLLNGYAVIVALLALLAWPLVAWRRANGGGASPDAPEGVMPPPGIDYGGAS
jgi:membrane protease YdiL (CAAX protease family)